MCRFAIEGTPCFSPLQHHQAGRQSSIQTISQDSYMVLYLCSRKGQKHISGPENKTEVRLKKACFFQGHSLHYIRMTELKNPCRTQISDRFLRGVHQEQELPNQLIQS
uniref:Uncharacterized protein n=1 Tax=Opuntia streptacantha TaxID=393608 RepID=A0A7C9CVT3_OPUST